MKPETLEALKKSIKHWEQLRDGESKDTIGPHSCALCQMFWKRVGVTEYHAASVRCDGCPVADRSGKPGCSSTPYDLLMDYEWTLQFDCESDWQQSEEFKKIAALELKFLVSLLPFEEWLVYKFGCDPQPDCYHLVDDKDCLDRKEDPCPSCVRYAGMIAEYHKLETQPMIDFNG